MRPMLAVLWLVLLIPVAARAQDDRVGELERKVDVLTREIADLKLGAAADTTISIPRLGLGRGAAKVYGARGVSIGGYGEMLYENFDRERQDEALSGARDRIDFLRHVVYLGYKFTDDLLLNSEIELEHAGVQDEAAVEGTVDPLTLEVDAEAELSGEVVLEFAYVDWALRREIGLRAGLLLVPIGLVNEMHEPTSFFGARRPEVEQRILPSTWSANGAGIYGEIGNGFTYRAYLIEGLDAAHFSSAGIRGGRQGGSRSLATKPALAGRLDWTGLPGLVAGVSIYTGDSWQDAPPGPRALSARLTLWDFHLRAERSGLELRALYAAGTLAESGDVSLALGLPNGSWIGTAQRGGYVELGYDVFPMIRPGSALRLVPFARWERFDPQVEAADGNNDPSLERTVVTVGTAFQPHTNVVFKLDRQQRSNRADTETSQWNAALGYVF